MLLVQFTGLSGVGKSTLANGVKKLLNEKGYRIEIIDGDIYRKILCPDLGFSKEDRNENIRRLGFVANLLATNGVIAILAAINPYEKIRKDITSYGSHVKTVWINCDLETLVRRDTKKLYRRAMLSNGHPDKINNLTGINDPYEPPENADLIINTNIESEENSIKVLFNYMLQILIE